MAAPWTEKFPPGRATIGHALLERTQQSIHSGAKHYTLLLGEAGMGKSTLLQHLAEKLATEPRLSIASIERPEWKLFSFADLLQHCHQSLAPAGALPTERTESALRASLEKRVGDSTLLLLLDDLDRWFPHWKEREQRAWRAWLQEWAQVTIIATARRLFPEIHQRSAPFFGFYRIDQLEPLSPPETLALAKHIAHRRRAEALLRHLNTPAGAIHWQSLDALLGGVPARCNLAAHAASIPAMAGQSWPLAEIAMATLDQLAPREIDRHLHFSPQQRQILATLTENPEATPVKNIALALRAKHSTVAAQLKLLREEGIVRSHEWGRQSLTEIADPNQRWLWGWRATQRLRTSAFLTLRTLWQHPSSIAEAAHHWLERQRAREWQHWLEEPPQREAGEPFSLVSAMLTNCREGDRTATRATLDRLRREHPLSHWAWGACALQLSLEGRWREGGRAAEKGQKKSAEHPLYPQLQAQIAIAQGESPPPAPPLPKNPTLGETMLHFRLLALQGDWKNAGRVLRAFEGPELDLYRQALGAIDSGAHLAHHPLQGESAESIPSDENWSPLHRAIALGEWAGALSLIEKWPAARHHPSTVHTLTQRLLLEEHPSDWPALLKPWEVESAPPDPFYSLRLLSALALFAREQISAERLSSWRNLHRGDRSNPTLELAHQWTEAILSAHRKNNQRPLYDLPLEEREFILQHFVNA